MVPILVCQFLTLIEFVATRLSSSRLNLLSPTTFAAAISPLCRQPPPFTAGDHLVRPLYLSPVDRLSPFFVVVQCRCSHPAVCHRSHQRYLFTLLYISQASMEKPL